MQLRSQRSERWILLKKVCNLRQSGESISTLEIFVELDFVLIYANLCMLLIRF